MQVLAIDAAAAIDDAVLRALCLRGHEITAIRAPHEALALISRNEFDCILVDISTAGNCLGLEEMRHLVRTSAVALTTPESVEALTAVALAEGSIEFRSLPDLIAAIESLEQPALLVGLHFHPTLIQAIRDKGLRFSFANTLQFALNLLVDGWCQIVCLSAEIPGWVRPDGLAIIHHIAARELAILVSGLSSSGVTTTKKPQRPEEFFALFQNIAGNRLALCGLTESAEGHRQKDRL